MNIRILLLLFVFGTLLYVFSLSGDFKIITAGVAIFLFGMLSLERGFKVFSGGVLSKILEKSTNNTIKSISFGAVATMVMFSSSLVSILTISFISVGIIGLIQGIGIIFGANIGTALSIWIIAGLGLKIKISAYALPMLVFAIILVFQKSDTYKAIGYILAGLGFLFLGISYMKDGFEAFKSAIDLSAYGGVGFKFLMIYTLIGLLATIIMQSSHASLIIAITALSTGQISYENAIALAIGANIGTTITAILGSLGSNITGKRLAGVHLIFNIITGLIALVFIHQFTDLVEIISTNIGIADDNHALKLAVFHTLFNLTGVLLMSPFIKQLANLVSKILKDKQNENKGEFLTSKYLSKSALHSTDSLVVSIVQETKHLFSNAFIAISDSLGIDTKYINSDKNLKKIPIYVQNAENIDTLYDKRLKTILMDILEYSTKTQNMNHKQIDTINKIRLSTKNMTFAVDNIALLQDGGMQEYFKAKNTYIQQEYKNIIITIAHTIREINKALKTSKRNEAMFLLSKTKVYIHKYNAKANTTISKLIQKSHISIKMASSLMNDNNYALHICNNLISMVQVLIYYGVYSLHLNNADIKHILKDAKKDSFNTKNSQNSITKETFFEEVKNKINQMDIHKSKHKLNDLLNLYDGFNKQANGILASISNATKAKEHYEDLEIIKYHIKKIYKIVDKIIIKNSNL